MALPISTRQYRGTTGRRITRNLPSYLQRSTGDDSNYGASLGLSLDSVGPSVTPEPTAPTASAVAASTAPGVSTGTSLGMGSTSPVEAVSDGSGSTTATRMAKEALIGGGTGQDILLGGTGPVSSLPAVSALSSTAPAESTPATSGWNSLSPGMQGALTRAGRSVLGSAVDVAKQVADVPGATIGDISQMGLVGGLAAAPFALTTNLADYGISNAIDKSYGVMTEQDWNTAVQNMDPTNTPGMARALQVQQLGRFKPSLPAFGVIPTSTIASIYAATGQQPGYEEAKAALDRSMQGGIAPSTRDPQDMALEHIAYGLENKMGLKPGALGRLSAKSPYRELTQQQETDGLSPSQQAQLEATASSIVSDVYGTPPVATRSAPVVHPSAIAGSAFGYKGNPGGSQTEDMSSAAVAPGGVSLGGSSYSRDYEPESETDQDDDGGTVFCTELYRQGLMPEDVYRADSAYGEMVDPVIRRGYWAWAVPLVRVMARSKTITRLVRPVVMAWAEHAAWMMGVRPDPNPLGSLSEDVGKPLCWLMGVLKNEAFKKAA